MELVDPSGEFFEVERILAAIQPIRHHPLREISHSVIGAATRTTSRYIMMRFR